MQTEDLPAQIRDEIKSGNLVRAAYLAGQAGISPDKTRELQRNAVRQFIEVLHNFEGARELISMFELDSEEILGILRDVLDNPTARTELLTCINKKNGKMLSLTLAEMIRRDSVLQKYL